MSYPISHNLLAMPDPTQLPAEKPSTFAFVEGLNNTYSTKATRSHVMTTAYREKKKMSSSKSKSRIKAIAPRTWTFEIHNSSPPPKPRTPNLGLAAPIREPACSFSASPLSDIPSGLNSTKEVVPAELSTHPSFQPRTCIAAGRIDHFCTLPVSRTPIIDEFVAACTCFKVCVTVLFICSLYHRSRSTI